MRLEIGRGRGCDPTLEHLFQQPRRPSIYVVTKRSERLTKAGRNASARTGETLGCFPTAAATETGIPGGYELSHTATYLGASRLAQLWGNEVVVPRSLAWRSLAAE